MSIDTSSGQTGPAVFTDPEAYLAQFGISATLVAVDNVLWQAA
jgi:hypothetical protein